MEGATTGTEPWFGFDYAAAPLPPKLLQGWSEAAPDPALQLPQPNAFIASDFALVCDDSVAAAGAAAANDSKDGPGANGTAHLQVRLVPSPPPLPLNHSAVTPPSSKLRWRLHAQADDARSATGQPVSSSQPVASSCFAQHNAGCQLRPGISSVCAATLQCCMLTLPSAAQTAPSAFPEPPALAAERPGLRLWHKADAAFRVPRVAAAFMLASPAAYGSTRAAALTHLAAKLLEARLEQPWVSSETPWLQRSPDQQSAACRYGKDS